mmetsp:Transcript_6393/g.15411  ORF Transcript_6393/g.15411 Transcript_6393/m.15411 type:complete len:394 (+) Transcript_6393:795-1976(+)
MVGAARDGDDAHLVEVVDLRGREAWVEPANAKLAVVAGAPRPRGRAVEGARDRVRLACGDRADRRALQPEERRGRLAVLQVAVAELASLADAPREDVALLGEHDRVEGAARQLRDVLPLERRDGGGREAILVVAQPQLALPAGAPREDLVVVADDHRVRVPARYCLDRAAGEGVDLPRRALVGRLAMAKLSKGAGAPGEDVALHRCDDRVLLARGGGLHALRFQRGDLTWKMNRGLVAMAEPTMRAVAPRVDLAVRRDGEQVPHPGGEHRHSVLRAAQPQHARGAEHQLVLLPREIDPRGAAPAVAPRVHVALIAERGGVEGAKAELLDAAGAERPHEGGGRRLRVVRRQAGVLVVLLGLSGERAEEARLVPRLGVREQRLGEAQTAVAVEAE